MRFSGCTMPFGINLYPANTTKEAQKLLEGISSDSLIVGLRRSKKIIEAGNAKKAYVAEDIAPQMFDSVVAMLDEHSVDYETVASKTQLGKACRIDCDAAIVVVKK